MNTEKLNTISLLVVVAGFLYITSGVMKAYGWPGLVGTVVSLSIALVVFLVWSRVSELRS